MMLDHDKSISKILQTGLPKIVSFLVLLDTLLILGSARAVAADTIRLDKNNPRYFHFLGRTTPLIGSGEHYGSVLNSKFDFEKYIDTLAKDGLNYTRIFSGEYVEPKGAFGIERNTLAPGEDYLSPWARSEEPGYPEGGNRFDLTKWNNAYFDRLHRFLSYAESKGVAVELTFFCSIYADPQWAVHPFNPKNNVNQIEVADWHQLHTLNYDPVNKLQKAFVQKLVGEVANHSNVFFEIQNEPWADRPVVVGAVHPYINPAKPAQWPNSIDTADEESIRWQRAVAGWITDTESSSPNKHLIAQNWCNYFDAPPPSGIVPNVSIVNFHYAYPKAAIMNRGLGKVAGYDETGFLGTSDEVYRKQAWKYLMAGGGLFNHLDYSFSVGHEDGSDTQPNSPGGGSATLRQQIGYMSAFFNRLEFAKMESDSSIVESIPGGEAQCLALNNQYYAFYFDARTPTTCKLNLPRGQFMATRFSPTTGKSFNLENLRHNGGVYSLELDKDSLESAWYLQRVPFPAARATQ